MDSSLGLSDVLGTSLHNENNENDQSVDLLGLSFEEIQTTNVTEGDPPETFILSDKLGTSLDIEDANVETLGLSLDENIQMTMLETSVKDVYDFQSDSESGHELIITSTPMKSLETSQGQILTPGHDLPSPLKTFEVQELEPEDESVLSTSENSSISSDEDSTKKSKPNSSSLLKRAITTAGKVLKESKLCENSCIASLGLTDVKAVRHKFWSKNYRERTEWLVDKLEEKININNETYFTIVHGHTACAKCFCLLYNISKNFYYKCCQKVKDGQISNSERKTRDRSNLWKEGHTWLTNYSRCYGDKMPDKNEVLLPYKLRKQSVYEKYADETTANIQQPLARSTFMKMWKEKFPSLKIKKTNSFSKCSKCTELEKKLETETDPAKRKIHKMELDVHHDRQMQERLYYYDKRDQARRFPDNYLSIIIDGMDQSKTDLPHFTGRKSKGLETMHMLKTHIQGVINHGEEKFYTFVDVNQYRHDSNLVVNTIVKVLKQSVGKKGTLPPVLYIQADNCSRENKNKYILAFCELLVKLNIFREVHLSFLYVGHTHEDIDANFSKISTILKQKDASTLPRLLDLLPNGKLLRGLYDFKKWIDPVLNTFDKHRKPLHFLFKAARNGESETLYKGQNNASWLLGKQIIQEIPQGIPDILLPEVIHKIDTKEVLKSVEKARHMFTEVSSYNWWTGFLKEIENVLENEETKQAYAKEDAEWFLPQLPKQKPEDVVHNVLPESVHEMLDQELDIPVIRFRETRKKKKITKKDATSTTR